ncbi:MAG: GDSL-like Lipase/Acylhydrolase [Moraxellaceae bacterium]|jgi:hypothetical protein|nr:GDSL-like Lipase/Acylhydrolase [Moraxellaceae bacterium]
MHDVTPSRFRRFLFPALLAFFSLVLLALVYGGTLVYRGLTLYEGIKWYSRDFIGRVYAADPAVGYRLAPNARGSFAIPLGDPVPVFHDAEGLRAPQGVQQAVMGARHPRLLFLGDSFTYGSLVAAEDTFPYLAAQHLGGETVNGGVPGYGLAQMVRRAEELIPKYKPDYVVVQYSPWLVQRAISEFAPADNGYLTAVPYYTGDAAPEIVAPAFPPQGITVDAYRTTPRSLGDRLSFLWNVALPKYVYEDFHLYPFRLRQFLSLAPEPSGNGTGVLLKAYADIDAIAQRHQARTVILVLGNSFSMEVPELLFPPQALRVNAQQALLQRLPVVDSEHYMRAYWLMRGNPPRPVDWHPNERAHALIAEVLAQDLRRNDVRSR